MSWKITVGAYQLGMIESVEIVRSVELLSDTAEIILPSAAFNQAFELNDKLRRGDAVKIELGYDDILVDEFDGFLREDPVTDNGSLVLKCEDALFQFRKSISNTVLKNIRVSDILKYVNSKVGNFTLKCDYDFTYDKFVISDATGYDILKKIQEEAKPNIYLKGNVLHVHPQYTEIFGTANYDFSKNIETANLKYRREEDRKYLIVVESKNAAGKVISEEVGVTGGDKLTLKISGVTSRASLIKLANETLKTKSYSGYEGSFKGWLIPYCDAGYKVKIVDADYEYKTGTYYVLEVTTKFSAAGGSRDIRIGKKLSNG